MRAPETLGVDELMQGRLDTPVNLAMAFLETPRRRK